MSDDATKTSQFLKPGLMDKIQYPPAFCQKLKAVGLRTPVDPNDLDKLYDFLQKECGVSETECRVMKISQADACLARWLHKHGPMEANNEKATLNNRIHWYGTQVSLAAHLIHEREKGTIKARSDYKAVTENIDRYVLDEDGKLRAPKAGSAWSEISRDLAPARPRKRKILLNVK
jgi:hypothetical protein